ncbi:MAG: hypothetical protein HYU36_07460 [Planctomycetes bacterium]|nr:hypothetical protein [Planctomycetota bacterium]
MLSSKKPHFTWLVPAAPILLSILQAQEARNQLQNASFEEDWLVSENLARRRWNLVARAEAGAAESDGRIDHWEAPAAWRDADSARSGRFSVKLPAGQRLTQAVRAAMRSPRGGNPASQGTDFQPLEPADLAKLEPRTVRGGAWVKAAGLAEGKARLAVSAGKDRAESAIPGGTYDWRWVEVASPTPWPPAESIALAIEVDEGSLRVDDASLAEDALGPNLAVNGGLEKLDPQGWPEGYGQPEAFWWFRFDYYSWTGWGHDGGYGCQIPQRIGLVPGYRWRGHAAVDTLARHSGRQSIRLVAFPGDNFGVLGPAVPVDGGKPFELGVWAMADRIHQIELMAVDDETNEYLLMDTDHFAGLEGVGVAAGSKGQGSYGWTYLRKLVCPRHLVRRIRPMVAVRGFDGRIIEKNVVGTAWFDDLEVIPRGGGPATPLPPPTAKSARLTALDLGDRLWGRNQARFSLQSDQKETVDVQISVTSARGRQQQASAKARLAPGKPATVELPYRIDDLCSAWNEQYQVEISVTAGKNAQIIRTAFGTPSSLLATRVSHTYLFPEEKLAVAANLQISSLSLGDLSSVVLQITGPDGQAAAESRIDQPGGKLPILVPEAVAIRYLNVDRCVTLAPDISNCRVRPWKEAARDYAVSVRLLDKAGGEVARAEGIRFGRLTHFGPSEINLQSRFSVNGQHFLLADGQPVFPVYFGEYGDTFRPEEGINITRDQIAQLGANPNLLKPEEKQAYGMTPGFGGGEWDLNGLLDLKREDVSAALEKFRAAHPGQLIISGYDMVSHPGSRRADAAAYFFPSYDVAGMEASFASYVPNLKVDYFPAMKGKNCAILLGFEHYYFVPYDTLRYRSYLSVMRGAAGLGLIPSRMMEPWPECNNYLRGMNAECRALAAVFAAPVSPNPTRNNAPGLFTWEKEFQGKRFLFAVRGEPFLTRGLFQWTDRPSPGGKPAHSEPRYPLLAQHWAENARPHAVSAGDAIVQELFIEGDPPRMLALQFRTRTSLDHTWEHRAYWGKADLARFVAEAEYPMDQKPPAPWPAWMVAENPPQPINSASERGAYYFEVLGGRSCKAADGQPSFKRLGDVPEPGQWTTLKIPAAEIGLEGQTLDGIAFSVDGGQVFWGKTALVSSTGAETALIDGSLERLAVEPGEWSVRFTVPGIESVRVRALFENVVLKLEGNAFEDRFPLPYRARVYEIEQ